MRRSLFPIDFITVCTNPTIRTVLDLAEFPVALVGYDMGGAVAVGFAAKFPNLCASVAIIGPLGVKYKPIMNEKLLNRNYIGEYIMYRQQKAVLVSQEFEFHDRKLGSAHRYMIDKQSAMVEWQIKYTPGYLGGLLSTFRYFPLRGMEELFTAIGRHPRKVLVMWGDHDTVCAYRKCITLMEESFPDGTIVDILDCGHNCVIEKFEEVARELLSFIRKAFEKR